LSVVDSSSETNRSEEHHQRNKDHNREQHASLRIVGGRGFQSIQSRGAFGPRKYVRNFAVLPREAARALAARVVVPLLLHVFAFPSVGAERTAPRLMRIIALGIAKDRGNVLAEFLGVWQAEIRLDGVALAVEKLGPKIIHGALTGRLVEAGVFRRVAEDVLDFTKYSGKTNGTLTTGTLLQETVVLCCCCCCFCGCVYIFVQLSSVCTNSLVATGQLALGSPGFDDGDDERGKKESTDHYSHCAYTAARIHLRQHFNTRKFLGKAR